MVSVDHWIVCILRQLGHPGRNIAVIWHMVILSFFKSNWLFKTNPNPDHIWINAALTAHLPSTRIIWSPTYWAYMALTPFHLQMYAAYEWYSHKNRNDHWIWTGVPKLSVLAWRPRIVQKCLQRMLFLSGWKKPLKPPLDLYWILMISLKTLEFSCTFIGTFYWITQRLTFNERANTTIPTLQWFNDSQTIVRKIH